MNNFTPPESAKQTSRLYLGIFLSTALAVAGFFFNFFPFFLAVAVAPWLCLLLYRNRHAFLKIEEVYSAKKCLLVLSAICLFTKLLFVLLVRIEPQVDYLTFYSTADALSQSEVIDSRYVALFPHIFGYSYVLSLLFKLFGAAPLVAALFNVALTLVSGILLFEIARRLIHLPAAVFAYLAFILCPSQTIYNIFVLSEPLYTTFLLLVFYLLVRMHTSPASTLWGRAVQGTLFGALCGFLLFGIDTCRPLASILLIALFLWFCFKFRDFFRKEVLLHLLPFAVACLLVFLPLSSVWDDYVAHRLGEEPSSLPGFNLLVGINPDTYGTWSEEDSKLLYRYSESMETANEVQEKLLVHVKDRLGSGEVNFPVLIVAKFFIFLGIDSACVDYAKSVLHAPNFLIFLSNAFYYVLLFFSFFRLFRILRVRKTPWLVFLLFACGLTAAHLIAEVEVRYHYSLLPVMILLTCFSLFKPDEKKQPE